MILTKFDLEFLRAVGISPASVECDEFSTDDPTLAFMLATGLRLTRENYLYVSYFGDPPELDAETEAELPGGISE